MSLIGSQENPLFAPLLPLSVDSERELTTIHFAYFFTVIVTRSPARLREGIVAKRKLSIYKHDGQSWLKIKNRAYSQAEGRHELLTRKPKP